LQGRTEENKLTHENKAEILKNKKCFEEKIIVRIPAFLSTDKKLQMLPDA